MYKSLILIIILSFINLNIGYTKEIKAYFAPKGGFHKENKDRKININGKDYDATINNAALELIEEAPENSEIRIVMYAFSLEKIQKALLDAAINKNIAVKVIVDNVASWTNKSVNNFHKLVSNRLKDKSVDFIIKRVTKEKMIEMNRVFKRKNGSYNFGTMHEKFAVFFDKTRTTAVHSFSGSSNISISADQLYAENRLVYKDCHDISKRYNSQFIRLWNDYTVDYYGTSNRLKPIDTKVDDSENKIIFNIDHYDAENFHRIDIALMNLMELVNPENGTIDVAMYSFTSWMLSNKLIEIAQKYPKVRIRLLFDHEQIEKKSGSMAGKIARKIEKLGIKNILIRHKWQTTAYDLDSKGKMYLEHFKSHVLHHKFIIINNEILVNGSYNWSRGAEHYNLEDIIILKKEREESVDAIDRFINEFNHIWYSTELTMGYKSAKIDRENLRALLESEEYKTLKELKTKNKKLLLMDAYKQLKMHFSDFNTLISKLTNYKFLAVEKVENRVYIK